MAMPPIVALEIGTSKIIVLVGEMREDENVMITGMGECPSVGIRKGEVIDIENAVACTRSALEMAEESGKVEIRHVHLAVSGGHIQSLINRGDIPVLDKEGEISKEDIEQVIELAKAVNLPSDREFLHTICQHFCIDNQERVIRPEGMEGAKLSLNMLVLHGLRSRLRNAIKVVRSIPVEVGDVAFSGLCSALSVLTAEQKKSGVIVIDLGGGTTDYLVYNESVVAFAGALGVGGDHITNDIAIGFNIPAYQAEQLKRKSGSAVIDASIAFQKVSLPSEVGFQGRTISLNALHKVINARVYEILMMIQKSINHNGSLQQMGAGVVLTGGGSHLKDVAKLTEKIFGLPCSIGKPRNISGLAIVTEGPEYSTCSGLVQYGFKTLEEEKWVLPFGKWFKGLFGR